MFLIMSCDLLVLPVTAELNLCSATLLLAFEGPTLVLNGASSAFGCIRVLTTLCCRSTSSRSVPALSRAWGYGCGRAKAPSAVLGWGTRTEQSISGIDFISPRKTVLSEPMRCELPLTLAWTHRYLSCK